MSKHLYYPLNAELPYFQPNVSPLISILSVFGAVTGAVVIMAWIVAARQRPLLRPMDQFAASWFALCGFLHVAFEGYYIYYGGDEISSKQSVFAQLWKEYTLSDSRYLTSDVFTVCVETITVFFWGPLSWLTFLAIIRHSPSRHFSQVVVCVAHLYGVALYYSTNWMDYRVSGISYSRPEFLYYWVYYIGFNFPWVVVPIVLLHDSWNQTVLAFRALQKVTNIKSE